MSLLLSALLGLLGAEPAAPPARVIPSIGGEDPRLSQSCRVRALRPDVEVGGPVEEGIDLAPGPWWIVLDCPDPGGRTVVVPGPRLVVRAREVARPRVRLGSAPLRVIVRRNGQPAAGRVRLRLEGLDRDVQVLETGVTAWVGRGPWRLHVEAGPATVVLPTPRWRAGRKTTVVKADLSDGSVTVDARLDDRPAEAIVRTVDEGGQFGPPHPSGAPIRLSPGRHRLKITLADAADFQSRIETVEVQAARRTNIRARFSGGWVKVRLTRDGAPLEASVQLAKPGAGRAFGHVDAPGRALLRPGRYRLWVEDPSAGPTGRYALPDVTVKARRVVEAVADLTAAEIRAEVEGAGADLPVVLRRAGGGAVVAPVEPRFWRTGAGRYELVIQTSTGEPIVDGPFEVQLGQRSTRVISVRRVELELHVLRAGSPVTEAEVRIFRPGAGAPLRRAPSGSQVVLPPGRYDVEASLDGVSRWRRGVQLDRSGRVDIELPTVEGPPPPPPAEHPAPGGEAP